MICNLPKPPNHPTGLGEPGDLDISEELLRSGSSSSFLEGRFSVWIPNGRKIQEGTVDGSW